MSLARDEDILSINEVEVYLPFDERLERYVSPTEFRVMVLKDMEELEKKWEIESNKSSSPVVGNL